MTKFKYPIDGIYNSSKVYFEAANSKIMNSVSKANNLFAPPEFYYKKYINDLKSTLSSMRQELDVIERLFKKIDNTYKSMSLDIQSNMSKIEFYDIKERERMIK